MSLAPASGEEAAHAPAGAAPAERLRVEQLGMHFGRTIALHGVSFRAGAGERLALIGPNGAGKSTLLSCLATLQRPSEGRVLHDGTMDGMTHRQQVRGRIGLVAHDVLVYGELTARENLRLHAGLHGLGEGVVTRWLERVGLERAADRAVAGYSRGMKQRLALARALLNAPDLVLLDEPLTGLDREGQSFLWTLLDDLRAAGALVIVVTHHLEAECARFDRVLAVVRGRLRHDGPSDGRLLDAYAHATGGSP